MPETIFVTMNTFGSACLEALLKQGKDISEVITLPPEKTAQISDYQDVVPLTKKYGVKWRYCRKLNDLSSEFTQERPAVIFIMGWSQIISDTLLSSPLHGCIGSHPSLLPKNRGRAAIPWHFINNEKFGGLSLFYLDEQVDHGPVIAQARFPIKATDNASTYYQNLLRLGPQLLLKHFDAIITGTTKARTQDHTQATYLLIRRAEDSYLNFFENAQSCVNQVRAVTDLYPAAFFFYQGERYTTKAARVLHKPKISGQPGQIALTTTDSLIVLTGKSMIELKHIERASQPINDLVHHFKIGAFLNGHHYFHRSGAP